MDAFMLQAYRDFALKHQSAFRTFMYHAQTALHDAVPLHNGQGQNGFCHHVDAARRINRSGQLRLSVVAESERADTQPMLQAVPR
jgi:fumarate hydratase class II